MKIITLDFETYYDRAFSLSRLTTEEYIRDEQFEVIGVSVQEDDRHSLSTTVSERRVQKFSTPWANTARTFQKKS
jgi:hypothetical protein